jgi:hypothetical protein
MVKPFTPEFNQKVYLQPVGNFARGWNGKPLIGYVSAVKRKYFYVMLDNRTHEEFRAEIATCQHYDYSWNGGYNVFPTEEAFRNHMVIEKQRSLLAQNTYWMQSSAPDEAISQIYAILEDAGVAPKVQLEF